jgi:hypothetical protein
MDAAAAADAPAGDGGRKDGPGGIKKKVAYWDPLHLSPTQLCLV